MKTVVYFAIVLLLPVTSSQPTYDGTDGSCQMQDNTMLTFLRNEFHSIKSEISHVKRILAQLQRNKDNVKSPSSAGGSCTCRLAATDSPCGTTGGYDCTCDETDDCASAHVCGEESTCDIGYAGALRPPNCSVNVALLRTAIQSSTWEKYTASLAVDSNLNTVSCTDGSTTPWWSVDLGTPIDVGRACITNDRHPAIAQRRMSHFVVGLTNNNPYDTDPVYKQYRHAQYDKILPPGATGSVSFAAPAVFRYVVVQQQFSTVNAVCMMEVKVFKRDYNPDPRQCTPGTPGICHQHANCTQVTSHVCACNPASSYKCQCNQGYTGDGLTCTR